MKYLKSYETHWFNTIFALDCESYSEIKENLWKLGWELTPSNRLMMYYGQYNIEFSVDIENKKCELYFEVSNNIVIAAVKVSSEVFLNFDLKINENTDILNFEVLKKYLNYILELVQNCNEIIPVLDENNIDFPSFYDINHLDMIEDFNKECSELREEYGYLWSGKEMGLL